MKLLREYIRELLKEQNVLATGMCFPFAYQKAEEWFEKYYTKGRPGRSAKKHPDLNDKSKFKVVHGTVTNKWKSPPKPVVHGWVEMGDLVFDDQTKVTKPNGVDKEAYYDMYQPEVYKEFTAEEAILNCAMKGGEGPWDDDLYAMMQDRDAWMKESNEYSWETANRRNMLLDKEGMEQSDKDNQENFLKSLGLMELYTHTLLEQASSGSVVVVDVQPEYESGFSFDIGDLLHAANEYNKVLFLYNGADTLGMVSEDDLRHYYFEKLDYDEELFDDLMSGATFFDKGYGFFRDVMDSNVCFDRTSVVKIVEYMIDNNVQDIRDLDEEDVEKIGVSELLFDDLEDYGFWVPELSDILPSWSGSDIMGGARNECMAEVEILGDAQGLAFNQRNEFIYEGDGLYTERILTEKYGKKQKIINQESYSTMIQFRDEDDMFLPLGSQMMTRIFGSLKQEVKGYHITNLNGAYGLLDIRGTSKQASVFTRGANADFIKGGITARGGVVIEVEGQQIASGMEDMFTLPEKGGRRNITMEYIVRLVKDPSITDPMKKDLLSSINGWLEKNEPEAGTGLDTWREVARRRDKVQLNSMIKHYLDSAEKVMMKYAGTLREAVVDSVKLPSDSYHRLKMYDEIVMDKIQVKNVYIWKKYYQRRGMPNHPSEEEFRQFIQEMSDEGIDVYTATIKEIVNMVDGK